MAMQKIYGATGRQDGLYKIGRNKYELIYGFGKDTEDAETGYNYRQRFNHVPTPEEVKLLIISTINADTDEKILNGFSWKGKRVWLSTENQFNYKAAYDLAVQKGGATLPVTFKFGTDEAPEYHTFNDMAEFTDFYTQSLAHVSTALAAGWSEKDALGLDKFNLTIP